MAVSLSAIRTYLLSFGALGLFGLALLDSAMVPLPGGADAVLLLLAALRPSLTPLYVLSAVVGSAIGSLVLYSIAGRGGDLVLARISAERRRRIHDALSRYEFWTIFVSVLLPPPFPTKPFVLMAGVLRMDRFKFLASVLAGRTVRYALVGILAARYGEAAGIIIKQQSWKLLVALLLVVASSATWFWLKRRSALRSAMKYGE